MGGVCKCDLRFVRVGMCVCMWVCGCGQVGAFGKSTPVITMLVFTNGGIV
jgi:hypothetical protein